MTKNPARIWAILCGLMLAPAAIAQDGQVVVPAATDVKVVPTLPYEPTHPRPIPASTIKPVNFQEPFTPPIPAPLNEEPLPPPVDFNGDRRKDPFRCWTHLGYLNWRISDAPINLPLITTSPAGAIGAIGESNTTVVFGAGSNQDTSFGNFSGLRLTTGGWLEHGYEYSWAFSAFLLERRGFVFSAISPGGAAPGISLPFRATQAFGPLNPAGETSLNSGGAPTIATVNLSSQLWGLELNETANLWSNENCYLTWVLGLRYLSFNENLTLDYTNFDVATGGASNVRDGFTTHNQYFAAQVGGRTGHTWGRWFVDGTALFMFGPMRQFVDVLGATTVTNGAFGFATGTTPVGLFAEPSNIGPHSRTVMAFGTDLQFKLGYALTARLQPFFSYDALYVSSVARPGALIDRNINPTQNAVFVPPGTLVGDSSPQMNIRGSGYWAHGIQLGVEMRY